MADPRTDEEAASGVPNGVTVWPLSEGDPPPERPTEPDPAVLAAVSRSLGWRHDRELRSVWVILARIERPRSTLFRLQHRELDDGGEVFYKADFFPRDLEARHRDFRLVSQRRSFRHEAKIAEELVGRLRQESIEFDHPLLLDETRLIAVRTAVRGVPIKRTARIWLSGSRSKTNLFNRIGRALAAIEDIGGQLEDEDMNIIGEIEREVARSAPSIPVAQQRRIVQFARELVTRCGMHRLVWSHGDTSLTNILLDGQGLGFVDFGWRPNVPAFAPAQLMFRLHNELPMARYLNSASAAAVWEGYGLDPNELSDSAKLACLQRALRSLRTNHSRSRRWGRNWIEQLLADYSEGSS